MKRICVEPELLLLLPQPDMTRMARHTTSEAQNLA